MIRSLIGAALWGSATQREARTLRRVVVHEWLTALGGSDKCAVELAHVSDAQAVYVFALDDELVELLQFGVPVRTWRGGRWVARIGRLQFFLPIMPIVWWSLDLRVADRVVTSSHCTTNAIRAPRAAIVSYCYTPMRYAWNWRLEAGRFPALLRPLMPGFAAVLRALDRRHSRSVSRFVAISNFVASRVRESYGRDSDVVYPAVDVEFWAAATAADRARGAQPDAPFLAAGRLVAYKETAVAVEAATEAGVALIVAGSGPELKRLQLLAGPTVRFVEGPDDDELRSLLASSRALLFPGVEDFGMLPVEAQAAGTPVIARAAGGALETVIDGVTGVHVEGADPSEWARVLHAFDRSRFTSTALRNHATTFSQCEFRSGIENILAATVARGQR
ncbi:MAG: glycosyltransferase involved in cell wall biosynthesis [Ilumatobacter sp.]|jgi:glycosyltransferase involved in cell wall biosynthesis